MFVLSTNPIDPGALKRLLETPDAGACVTFEGWVRNRNDGKPVVALAYEAYAEMAETEGRQILAEACDRFGLLKAACVHRTGRLDIGDMAVWVGVSTPHRQAAFDACRAIMDAIKHRLPIWKKEFYANGDSGWVNCEGCSHGHANALTPDQYYARQRSLPFLGVAGQERLSKARVLVVGAGGLGAPVLMSLAQAGVGTLGICDFDTVTATNLHRQFLYDTTALGHPKVDVARDVLQRHNPFLQVNSHPEGLTIDNAVALFKDYDLVLGCSDNFDTQFLLGDTAILTRTPCLQASVYQTEGWIQGIFLQEPGPCLRCLWPVSPEPGCTGTCGEVGTLGAVVNTLGAMQAMEALKFLLEMPQRVTSQTMLLVDLQTMAIQTLYKTRNPQCPLCGSSPAPPPAEPSIEDVAIAPTNWEALQGYTFVDIREPHETTPPWPEHIPALSIPMSRISMADLPPGPRYLLVCSHGMRSRYLARRLRNNTPGLSVVSLQGGIFTLEHLSLPAGVR